MEITFKQLLDALFDLECAEAWEENIWISDSDHLTKVQNKLEDIIADHNPKEKLTVRNIRGQSKQSSA